MARPNVVVRASLLLIAPIILYSLWLDSRNDKGSPLSLSPLIQTQQHQPYALTRANRSNTPLLPPTPVPTSLSASVATPTPTPPPTPVPTFLPTQRPKPPPTYSSGGASSTLPSPLIYVYPFSNKDSPRRVIQSTKRVEYRLETELLEGLRKRGRVTTDPHRATHFWIPHQLVGHWTMMTTIDDVSSPKPEMRGSANDTRSMLLDDYLETYLRPRMRQIYHDFPYYNRSQGSDHVFVYSMNGGGGPICEIGNSSELFTQDEFLQNMLRSMRKVGYWGQRGLVKTIKEEEHDYKHKKTISCWNDDLDIAVPQWHPWNMRNSTLESIVDDCQREGQCRKWSNYLRRRARETSHIFFFRGTIAPGRYCSPGIRPWIEKYCDGSVIDHLCLFNPPSNATPMTRAVFALSPAGSTCGSGRIYNALQQNVIPVLFADDMVLPFEQQLNYSSIMETIKTNTGSDFRTEDFPLDGGSAMRRLLDLGQGWMHTCQNDPQTKKCLNHAVSRKMMSIIRQRRMLGWQNVETSDENAFAMFEKELMRVNS